MRIPCGSPMRIPYMYCLIMLPYCCMLVVGLFEVFPVSACVERESNYLDDLF